MTSKVVAKYRHLATLEICQTRGTHTQSQSQKNGLRRLSAQWHLFMYVVTVKSIYIYIYERIKGCPDKIKRNYSTWKSFNWNKGSVHVKRP